MQRGMEHFPVGALLWIPPFREGPVRSLNGCEHDPAGSRIGVPNLPPAGLQMAGRPLSGGAVAATAGAATPHRRGPGRRAARAARRPVLSTAS
jgi:hypothetical protein